MEPKRLKDIRAREEAATEGPWEPGPDAEWRFVVKGKQWIAHCHTKGPGLKQARANTNFIAHAREDIPALLAYVEELEVAQVVGPHSGK